MSRDTATALSDRLRLAIEPGGALRRVTVLARAASTQDAARRLGAAAGDVVVACRQTAGRGRLGRPWADTGREGVAVSFVVPAGPAERLAVACAVGVAGAVESVLGRGVGLKWPNDVVVDGRKLAGILVEQADGLAIIGVGVNVRQTRWPPELQGRAVSLAQLGAEVSRPAVLGALLKAMNLALALDDERLSAAFRRRDVLEGTVARFRCAGEEITGTVIRVDPMRGLRVRTGREEEVYLPAAATSVMGPRDGNGPAPP